MFGPENFIIVASIITFLLWTIWHVSDLVNLAIKVMLFVTTVWGVFLTLKNFQIF